MVFEVSMIIEDGFAARLRWAREAKNLNMSELARALNVTPQAVQQWEQAGGTRPRRARTEEIAAALGVRFRWLAFGEAPMARDDASAAAPSRDGTAGVKDAFLAALINALPEPLRAHCPGTVTLGPRQAVIDYLSPTLAADAIFLDTPCASAQIRARLWTLALIRHLRHVQALLLLLPGADQDAAAALRASAAIQWEGHQLGLVALIAPTPDAAATILAAMERGDPATPPHDDELL